MRYLLDANCFMEAKDRWYRFGVCPGYWDWLAEANRAGFVHSVDHVRKELAAGGGDLAARAAGPLKDLFLAPDAAVLAAYPAVATWVQSHARYRADAKSDFLSGADPWLIAHAAAHGLVLVTLEMPAPQSLRRVKIPDACIALGVPFMNPFQMLELEGARFVLASATPTPGQRDSNAE